MADLIDDAIRCAKLAKDAYLDQSKLAEKYGPEHEGLAWSRWIENPTTDTQGFIVHRRERKELYYVFRGTKGAGDIAIDLKAFNRSPTGFVPGANSMKVHAGFYDSYDSIRHDIPMPWDLGVEVDRVFVTGHSLGGALANLVFCQLSEPSKDRLDVKLVTFGAPPTGNGEFANYLNRILDESPRRSACRVHAPHDPFPKLESRLLDVVHGGDSLFLAAEQNNPLEPLHNHSIITYLAALEAIAASGTKYELTRAIAARSDDAPAR